MGTDTKPDAECVSSVLMGCVWGEVVDAGASKMNLLPSACTR
jgi:hypothetical protein